MIQVKSAKFRNNFSEYLKKMGDENESIEIIVYKKPVGYLISPEDYLILLGLKKKGG